MLGWILAAYLLGLLVGGATVAYLSVKWMTRTWETLERMDEELWRASRKR